MKREEFKCPECGNVFDVYEDLEVGDTIDCSECYTEFEVMKLTPLKVRKIYDEEDDEEEEDDDDY